MINVEKRLETIFSVNWVIKRVRAEFQLENKMLKTPSKDMILSTQPLNTPSIFFSFCHFLWKIKLMKSFSSSHLVEDGASLLQNFSLSRF